MINAGIIAFSIGIDASLFHVPSSELLIIKNPSQSIVKGIVKDQSAH